MVMALFYHTPPMDSHRSVKEPPARITSTIPPPAQLIQAIELKTVDEYQDDVFTLDEAKYSYHEPIGIYYAAYLSGKPAFSEAETDAMSFL